MYKQPIHHFFSFPPSLHKGLIHLLYCFSSSTAKHSLPPSTTSIQLQPCTYKKHQSANHRLPQSLTEEQPQPTNPTLEIPATISSMSSPPPPPSSPPITTPTPTPVKNNDNAHPLGRGYTFKCCRCARNNLDRHYCPCGRLMCGRCGNVGAKQGCLGRGGRGRGGVRMRMGMGVGWGADGGFSLRNREDIGGGGKV